MANRLLWLVAALLVGGLIVLSSASIAVSLDSWGTPYHYVWRQLLAGILPGTAALLVLWRVPYRILRKLALPGLIGALLLVAAVFAPGFGKTVNGAQSWLELGAFSFQPAEFLKLALVVYLAAWLGKGGERLQQWHFGLLPFALIMGSVAVLLALQPDLGTLGVILAMAAGVYFVAGASWKQAATVVIAGMVLVASIAAISPERWERITTAFDPAADARGAGWQLNQSFIAIGAGGLWGVGLQESTQKFGFLPEPIGDSIFAVLVEELGFVGGVTTLALFAAVGITLIAIARRAADPFGSLLAAGMFMWIMAQALVNMTAITGIGPLTGIPLPFISYGGTSMVSLLAGVGIVLNVARQHAPRSHVR
jgi:cell division protein FtsW